MTAILDSAHPPVHTETAPATTPPVSVTSELQTASADLFVQYHEYFKKLQSDMQVPTHSSDRRGVTDRHPLLCISPTHIRVCA